MNRARVAKHRKGASLIIACILTVMLLGVSVAALPNIIATTENIQRGLYGSQFTLSQQSNEAVARQITARGENPFTGEFNGQDFSAFITTGDVRLKQDFWASTGCPIPHVNLANPQELGVGADLTDTDFFIEYGDLALDGQNNNTAGTTISLREKCANFVGEFSDFPHYFVYPTPLHNTRGGKPITVDTDCVANGLNKTGVESPLDHGCYWGRLDQGETVRIPLNRFGWNLGDISNLKLRLRLPCADGSKTCENDERETYDVEIIDPNIDDSEFVADWELQFEDGRVFGSSQGDRFNLVCDEIEFCRSNRDHSMLTTYKLKYGYFDLSFTSFGFLNRFFYTDKTNGLLLDLLSDLNTIFDQEYQNLDLFLFNFTKLDDLEYQIIMDRRLVNL